MSGFASLQLSLDERVEAARERIIYVVTAHMDSLGYMPCGRGSAERTVCFANVKGGWVVYDDCADRLDIRALDGLGRCLTGKLRTHAVGVMGSEKGRMLRLYFDGRLFDTYITSPKAFGKSFGFLRCQGHAIRWKGVLREGVTIKELSSAFLLGQQREDGFERLCRLISMDECTKFGFASIEEAKLPVITLYFCAANRVRQPLTNEHLKVPRSAGTILGALFRRPRCAQWK